MEFEQIVPFQAIFFNESDVKVQYDIDVWHMLHLSPTKRQFSFQVKETRIPSTYDYDKVQSNTWVSEEVDRMSKLYDYLFFFA